MRPLLLSSLPLPWPWLRRLVAAALGCALLAASVGQAWDRDRMTQAAQRLGPQAVAAVKALQPLLAEAARGEETQLLVAVNDFFNRRIAFADDLAVWGENDHWASPLETLARGQGDCEDYAIAKYFSLLAAGVPVGRLRLVYVRARIGAPGGADAVSQAHMVLAWYAQPGAEPLILDNLVAELRPASQRPDLTPVFSFNSEGLWQGTGSASAGDPVNRLSRWREVIAKARAEGFH
ncbi:transglutaminase-like cysteine peptidase [Piscinibacter sp.]|uniref:transglutaminase-like cysteine peptidase n=1 Tax=Piscinibacter sp. TaxID=1903157 RepID=UPI0039E69403